MLEKTVRILLVDDDEDDYFITRDLLSEIPDTHFELDWVSDYDEAIDLICRGEHDLYLIDYRLGKKDGLELIREANAKRCHVAMILLTGLGERALDFAAMEAGAADYLEKLPLRAARLERSIRYSLQSKRHAEELDQKVRERTDELAKANAALQEEIAERARAEAALRDADRRKDEFLATLAHELRNPLAPIRNAVEIIKLSHYDGEVIERSLGIIDRQTNQLVRLIEDLLDISRVSRGKIRIQKAPVALASIVESAIESVAPLVEQKGHHLELNIPAEPVMLWGDATRLSQVVANLVNNAAKYTEAGGHVRVLASVGDEEVQIKVLDDGIGIASDSLPRIFDMFTQAGRSAEHSLGGVGIGLWLVRKLVNLHGGRVEAYSGGAGQGSEFRVWLPRARSGSQSE